MKTNLITASIKKDKTIRSFTILKKINNFLKF